MEPPQLIGFIGYAHSGKDRGIVDMLIQLGYIRTCFGDNIKRAFDPLVQKYFGFSAFTENREEKLKIRALLEHGGEVLMDGLMREYRLETEQQILRGRKLANPRVMSERHLWRGWGGKIYEVIRPGIQPASKWEFDYIENMRRQNMIEPTPIINDGTLEQLRERILIDFMGTDPGVARQMAGSI